MLRKNLQVNNRVTFSEMLLKTSPEDLTKRRKYLREEHGFTLQQQKYIARLKPDFLMYDKDPNKGIDALSKLFVQKYGMSKDLVKTLVLKYPQILNKSDNAISNFFDYMKQNKKVDELTTMKLVFDVPLLLTTDVPSQSKEIEELFEVYHGISADEVTQIFLAFPYLYCCQTLKI